MTLVQTKSLEDWINLQLQKWRSLEPDININSDSVVYMDSAVIAEIVYLLQNDMVTLVNNAFFAYATGDELTNLWADRGINRLSATKATGAVTFGRGTKSPTNYQIDAGTIVSTQPAGTNGTTISYYTTTDAILYGTVGTPWIPSYTTQTTGGLLGNGTYKYKITAISGDNVETDASPNLDVTISNGLSTNTISLTWAAVPNAVAYNVYIFTGTNYVLLHQVTAATYVDTVGTSANIQTPPTTNNTGNLEVTTPVEAILWGAFGNVSPNTITLFVTKPVGLEYVYNALETSGGTDDEDDETYRTRISSVLQLNTWKTTILWYQQTAESVAGVATATVIIPTGWAYRNEINVVITSDSGSGIPTQSLIDSVQAVITSDENRAPCDAITVISPATHAINCTVNILSYDHGYSQAQLISNISDAISAYFRTIPVWQLVYVVGIANAVHDLSGILDFSIALPTNNVQLSAGSMAVLWTLIVNF